MSQELFERIVGSHGQETAAKLAVLPAGCRRAPERRASARVPFGKRTQIRRDSGGTAGKWATVVVQDVSRGGLGFLSEDEVRVGETFVIRLPQNDGRMARVRCEARRCEAGGFGGVAFLIGASFEQVIEEPSIRLNEDDGRPTDWDESVYAVPVGKTRAKKKVAVRASGGGIMRAAANLFRAVNWTRRHDDFSSN